MATQGIVNPYAAAGGKGGSMGGFQTPTTYPSMGQNPVAGGTAPAYGGAGKGGAGQPTTLPALPPGGEVAPPEASTMPAPTDGVVNPQGPNAFEQGLNAQNSAMDFYQQAMGGGSQQIMDMIANMANGSSGNIVANVMGGGGSSAPAWQAQSIAKDVYDYDAAQVNSQGYQAAQLSDADLSQYLNPYQQDVIDATMSDLGRARDSAMNATGVAATRGGAFGGDRHAIMESQNNADYMRQAASTSANLRNQGFQNAQNAAMSDINAMNQQRGTNAAAENAARMANAQSANERSQFVGSTANSNELAKQQLEAQMAARSGGGGTGNSGQIAQANAQLQAQKQQNALQAAMSMYGMQYDAANNYYQMGQDRWGMAQGATDALAGVGGEIDDLNQTLIDQIGGMFNQQTGAPQQSLDQLLAAMGGLTGSSTTTTSKDPGLMGWLGAGAGLAGAAGGLGWSPFGGK